MYFSPLRRCLFVLFCLFIATGCAPNRPWRYDYTTHVQPKNCSKCGPLIIERGSGTNAPNYDLAFIEFTDRGNVFSRDSLSSVYKLLQNRLDDDLNCAGGVTAIAYVHGWKHNARETDSDLIDFKARLGEYAHVARNSGEDSLPERCLVGIYIGWRGRSLNLMIAKELSFWDRKTAAHQLGKGGLTEVLLRIENRIQAHTAKRTRMGDTVQDRFLIVGHSFGATALISALNEIVLERVVTAEVEPNNPSKPGCLRTRNFAHGTVLLNPAIEANEILQLKESFQHARGQYCNEQQGLMHIISTRGDRANRYAFPLGQFFGTNLRWKQTNLKRTNLHTNEALVLSEKALDTTTVGNFQPFFTGYMYKQCDQWAYMHFQDSARPRLPGRSTVDTSTGCQPLPSKAISPHLFTRGDDPVHFIYTDRNFIRGHNGVFNQRVVAYLATIVQENVSSAYNRDADVPERCFSINQASTNPARTIDFGRCFNHYLGVLGELDKTPRYLQRVFSFE